MGKLLHVICGLTSTSICSSERFGSRALGAMRTISRTRSLNSRLATTSEARRRPWWPIQRPHASTAASARCGGTQNLLAARRTYRASPDGSNSIRRNLNAASSARCSTARWRSAPGVVAQFRLPARVLDGHRCQHARFAVGQAVAQAQDRHGRRGCNHSDRLPPDACGPARSPRKASQSDLSVTLQNHYNGGESRACFSTR